MLWALTLHVVPGGGVARAPVLVLLWPPGVVGRGEVAPPLAVDRLPLAPPLVDPPGSHPLWVERTKPRAFPMRASCPVRIFPPQMTGFFELYDGEGTDLPRK